jgi:hypothetical protein
VLEPVPGDGDIHPAEEIAERLQFAERHRWVLRQWLHEFATRGILHNAAGGHGSPVPAPIRSDLVAVCSDLGYLPPFGQFLEDANRQLADLVTDSVSVQELLFPNGSMTTVHAYYRDNAISRYLNLGARTAVADTVGAHDGREVTRSRPRTRRGCGRHDRRHRHGADGYFLMSQPEGRPQVGLTDVRAGTDRIFLTQDEWHDQLTSSGFTPVQTLPTDDHQLSLLDQYVFAAVRR